MPARYSTVYVRLAIPGAPAWLRAPALERLLTHASTPTPAPDWRAEAFRAIAGGATAPPVAAAALYRGVGVVPGQWVCVATPVHLVAGMSDVTLSADGILQLDHAECAALAADFNSVFDDAGVRLMAVPCVAGGLLLCVFERLLEVATHEPQDVVGRDVFALQPEGRDAPRLRRLMSEMELWLFEHAVNRVRSTQGRAVVTGLWLWGGGATLHALPAVQGWTAGPDPLFCAYGTLAEFPRERAASRGGVLVCDVQPGATTWPEVEQRWLMPLSAALRAGDLERVVVSAADRAVRVEKGINWRFWRSKKPWWESFGLSTPEWRGDELPGVAVPADGLPADAVPDDGGLRGGS